MRNSAPLCCWLLAGSVLALAGCDSASGPSSPISVGSGTPSAGTPTTGTPTTGTPTTGTPATGSSNTLPTAVPDVAVVQAGSKSNAINVLGNDHDANGDALTITSVVLSQSVPPSGGGSSGAAPDGKSLRYTPPDGFVGTQTLLYTVSDGRGGLASALAIITVSPLAVPPAALPDVFTKVIDSPLSILDVLANDVDGAGGGLQVIDAASVATLPPGGEGTFSISNGALRYQPKAGFTGVETLRYTLRDANGATATASTVITLLPLAAPPVALPDVRTLALNTSSEVDVLANDVDLAGGGLTLTAVTPVASLPPGGGGSFSLVGNRVRYAPTSPTFVGTQTASYTLRDQNGTTATSLLTLVITPTLPAVPPVAVPDIVTRSSGTTSATLDVLANDIDVAGGGLTITAAQVMLGLPSSTGVTVASNGSALQLTLPANFAGVLTLSYTVRDANGSTATGAAVVTVAPAALPALPPVTVPDLGTLAQGSAATAFNVLANDIDPSGSGLTVSAASVLASLPVATHGVGIAGNAVQFTPAAAFAGVVTVQYTATDANGGSTSGLLTLTVTPPLPVALPAAVGDVGSLVVTLLGGSTSSFNVLANDIDPAAGGLTLQSVSFTNPLLVTPGSLLGVVGNQVQLTVPLLGIVTGVLPMQYTAGDSLGRTVTGLLNVTLSTL